MFRAIKAEEVECRVQTVKGNGFSLLLYKDARCDMAILDGAVGALGWKREHSRDNKNCTVSLWDKANNHWVSKEDTGTESNTEQQKRQGHVLTLPIWYLWRKPCQAGLLTRRILLRI